VLSIIAKNFLLAVIQTGICQQSANSDHYFYKIVKEAEAENLAVLRIPVSLTLSAGQTVIVIIIATIPTEAANFGHHRLLLTEMMKDGLFITTMRIVAFHSQQWTTNLAYIV